MICGRRFSWRLARHNEAPHGVRGVNVLDLVEQLCDQINDLLSSASGSAKAARDDGYIRDMLKKAGIDQSRFGSIFKDAYNRDQRCYKNTFHETMLLLIGYSVPLHDRLSVFFLHCHVLSFLMIGAIASVAFFLNPSLII